MSPKSDNYVKSMMVVRQPVQNTIDKQTNVHKIIPRNCLQLLPAGISDGNVNTRSAELLTA